MEKQAASFRFVGLNHPVHFRKMLPDCWHPAVLWAAIFGCLCVLIYCCTFRAYLKGVKGTIPQKAYSMANNVPLYSVCPKARNAAVNVFVIDVESPTKYNNGNLCSDLPYLAGVTLNYEAILKGVGAARSDANWMQNWANSTTPSCSADSDDTGRTIGTLPLTDVSCDSLSNLLVPSEGRKL
ncbi:uncharacterized protein LOC129751651 [Uranotaenia lowii]|uniref:uncharacterized protein LOC129751651 n=1 Tax=Uranotaenia lowii TaxID=190385 RepID=UPI0024792604|nr:uncharacterized protein LOC129751651 [Uranotaenia lowii]